MKFESKSLKFLEKYLNTASPTGYEQNGQKVWTEYIKPFVDEIKVDHYGTAYGIINPEAEFKVVIEAHADEISWYVNYITDDGLIYVIRNGGSDQLIAPSKIVHIHGEKGVVKGVFGWPAIHTRANQNEPTPKIENIFIDCGCTTKEEVENLGIYVGCMITYPDEFFEMNELSVKKDSYIAENTAMEADSDVIVDFNNVTFAYDDKNVVENLSFSIKK